MHNLCCNNCHSHVANCLNNMQYKDKKNYNMITVWWMLMMKSKYVSVGHIIKTYIGFVFIVLFWLAFVFLIKK